MAPAGTAIIVGRSGTAGFAHHFDYRDATAQGACAYVCRGETCFAPASDVAGLRTALWSRA